MTTLSEAIHRLVDPGDLLDRVVQQALTLIPHADGASLEMLRGEELEYVTGAGTLQPFVGLRLPLADSLSGTALRCGRLLRSDDTSKDSRVNVAGIRATGIRSMMCIPLSGSSAAAVLKVSAQIPQAFTERDEEDVRRLSGFLTSALQAAHDVATTTAAVLSATDGDEDHVRTARFVANVMDPRVLPDLERRSRIERLLAQPDAMTVVMQPIVDMTTGRTVIVEALSRFPDMSGLPITRIFAEAHACGLGASLERAAVGAALAALPELPPDLMLAVNVSPAALHDEAMVETLLAAPHRRLIVELTEQDGIGTAGTTPVRALVALRESGVALAIDDTGAGHSSLSRVLQVQPDIVKMDRVLTLDVERDPARQVLAEALVRFSSVVGNRLVAEGIETPEAAELLARLQVPLAQGYHFARPMPVPDLLRHLESGSWWRNTRGEGLPLQSRSEGVTETPPYR